VKEAEQQLAAIKQQLDRATEGLEGAAARYRYIKQQVHTHRATEGLEAVVKLSTSELIGRGEEEGVGRQNSN
jgi:hypothetical protein